MLFVVLSYRFRVAFLASLCLCVRLLVPFLDPLIYIDIDTYTHIYRYRYKWLLASAAVYCLPRGQVVRLQPGLYVRSLREEPYLYLSIANKNTGALFFCSLRSIIIFFIQHAQMLYLQCRCREHLRELCMCKECKTM